MADHVELKVYNTHIDLVVPECVIRFKTRDAFQRFREWVETARIVGSDRKRPVQTQLSDGAREEWYALAMGDGKIALHHFSRGDVDITIDLTEERFREIAHAVLSSSGEVP